MLNINTDKQQEEKWYVLRGRYIGNAVLDSLSKEMQKRSQKGDKDLPPLDFFAPRLECKRLVNGKLENTNRPFGGYTFVKGTKNEVLQLRNQYPTFNMVRNLSDDSDNDRYITVSDAEMRMFQFAVSLYNGDVPFIEVTKETLEKGDYVRVKSGHQFENVEGTLLTSQGKEGGRVVVSVCNRFAIPTLEIRPEYLEVIAFGKDSRHIYQTLDSYHPYIHRALKAKFSQIKPDEKDIDRIKKFLARYGKVDFNKKPGDENDQPAETKRGAQKVEDKKIRGRYYTYMLMSYFVLEVGSDAPIKHYVNEINKVMPFITNATTKAFIQCALYAATKSKWYLDEAAAIVATWEGEKLSKKQHEVMDDVEFYNKRLHGYKAIGD